MAGPAQDASSQGTISGRNGPSSSVQAGLCEGHSLGAHLEASGRRAKPRLIINGFTDNDLPDIESHSPALTREGFMTVLQSVCRHGHKLQFGNVQQAFNTGDLIKRGQPLFVRMPPDGIPRRIA